MKKILVGVLILSLALNTGCWDMKEINERIFPYSVGLDLVDKDDYQDGRYEITFTYPNINALGSQAIQEDIVYLTTTRANNIFEGSSNIGDRLQKPMYLRDLKVVVIPENLAKDKKLIKEIIDGLNREYVVNKVINFVVVKTSAKELLQTKVQSKKQIEIQGLLYRLLKNDQHSSKFITSTLNSFVKDMATCNASLVPVARIENKEDIIVDASAVFKDYKLIGYLDEYDNKNISIMKGDLKDFGINVEYEGVDLAIKVPKLKTKQRLVKESDDLKIRYEIEMRGQMEEYTLGKDGQLEDKDRLEDMEKALEKKVKSSMEKTVRKLQKDLNTDTIEVSDYLYKFHPKIWKQIEDDFDQIFPHIDIEIDIDVEIRRRGLSK